jgi:hypothetical protein
MHSNAELEVRMTRTLFDLNFKFESVTRTPLNLTLESGRPRRLGDSTDQSQSAAQYSRSVTRNPFNLT